VTYYYTYVLRVWNRAARLATNVCLDGHGRARPCVRGGGGTRHWLAARGRDGRARVLCVVVADPPPLPPRPPLHAPSPDLECRRSGRHADNNKQRRHCRRSAYTHTHTDTRTRAVVTPHRRHVYTRTRTFVI